MYTLNRPTISFTFGLVSLSFCPLPQRLYAQDAVCPADFDGDYQAGLSDFAAFHLCLSGPSACPEPGCREADLNSDGAVDLRDFAVLQRLFQSCDACVPRWQPVGDLNSVPGVSGSVYAATVFDDGCGPALYIGGTFHVAGGIVAKGVARWDGAAWTAVDSAATVQANALAVYDDGGGPALYAGGGFMIIGGRSGNHIAKWDGATWSPLGLGTSSDVVQALTVFDDGTGPALYAGGRFTTAGGVSANNIAKWDGKSWTPLGSGVGNTVYALIGFDDGSGPALYAGGRFTTAGGDNANYIARWDGANWTALGTGVSNVPSPSVRALSIFDDGSGPALYAGGNFTSAGGAGVNYVAKWDGKTWSPLGTGVGNAVAGLLAFDDGSGRALYAGGGFTTAGGVSANRIARWDGTSWSPLGLGMSSIVRAFAVFDDGGGESLFTGGDFDLAGDVDATGIARWHGATWSSLGTGQSHPYVHAFAVFDDSSGSALYWGGYSDSIGKWDGATLTPNWAPSGNVRALGVFDLGSGPGLYAGGGFNTVDGVSALGIARWDGASWTPLGSGVNGGTSFPYGVSALAAFDDGTGPALYAGGNFTTAGEVSANNIARWDGTSWAPLGLGTSSTVLALAVFDDGSGPALYAGGGFHQSRGHSGQRSRQVGRHNVGAARIGHEWRPQPRG